MDEPIRRRLREISTTDPRFGYRRAWAVLQREGFTINRKRVQRRWRAEGMRVPVLAAELNDHQTAAISDDGSAELAADVLMTSASAGCLATR